MNFDNAAGIEKILPKSMTLTSYINLLCLNFLIFTVKIIKYLLHRLNEFTFRKCLAQCLVHNKCSVNVGSCYLL